MAEVKKGVVNIHGKEYRTVAYRVNEFRQAYTISDGWGIVNEIVTLDEEKAVVKSTIIDGQGRVVATGHGEEYRKASTINRTSALENAETSAVGRALAAAGLGGEEYASADEVLMAIEQQKTLEAPKNKEPKKEVKPEEKNDLADTVLKNVERGMEVCGKQEYITWHKRVFSNFYGIDENEISPATKGVDLLSDEQLIDFLDKQKAKIGKE